MNVKKWLRGLCAAVLCVAYVGTAGAAELQKVPTAWMGAQETFPIWYAKQKGWDKEVGLDVELLYFSSGMDALSTLPAKTWVFGGMGAIPALMGALRHDTYVIANCNDEAMVNAVMVRPDSPIMQTKGYNKSYPNVYGTPESVKGKTVLCTTVSSAHFALSSWLKALGLTEKDVTIKNMDQASALAAFEYGIGDIVTLWAPLTYVGEKRGWKVASTPHDCYRGLPIVIVADREFADKNPEVTAKFLSIYMRAIDMMKNEPMDKLLPEYLRFYVDWAGTDYSKDLAEMDLKNHPVFNLEEQLQMFDASEGPSQAQSWQGDLAQFFAAIGRISQDELKKVENSSYVTDKFLKLIKTPLPISRGTRADRKGRNPFPFFPVSLAFSPPPASLRISPPRLPLSSSYPA